MNVSLDMRMLRKGVRKGKKELSVMSDFISVKVTLTYGEFAMGNIHKNLVIM